MAVPQYKKLLREVKPPSDVRDRTLTRSEEPQILKAGTSPATVQSVTFVDNGRAGTSTTIPAHQAVITVE